MKKIVASIKLAPGNRGYFDPLTGINLSLSNNMGYVRQCDDVTNIRKDIRNGKIKIVGGQLPPSVSISKPVKEKEEPKQEVKEIKEDVVVHLEEKPKYPPLLPAVKVEKKKAKKESVVKEEVKEPIVEEPAVNAPDTKMEDGE